MNISNDQLLELARQAGFCIEHNRITAVDENCMLMDDDNVGIECDTQVRRLLELVAETASKSLTTPSTRAVDRYIVLYAEAEELLAQIRERHDVNYGIEPSTVSWPHVGTMGHFVEILQYALHSMPDKSA